MSKRVGDVPPGDREATSADLAQWREDQAYARGVEERRKPGEVQRIKLSGSVVLEIGGHEILISDASCGVECEFIPKVGHKIEVSGVGDALMVSLKRSA